jgi:hypothetical protein
MQQQQQYQMYQQHVEGKQRLLLEGLGPVPAGGDQAVPAPQREIKERKETRVLISPKSIVEGGRLHSQAQANKQMAAQTVLHQQQQSNTYQGVQRSVHNSTTSSWDLASFLGNKDDDVYNSNNDDDDNNNNNNKDENDNDNSDNDSNNDVNDYMHF